MFLLFEDSFRRYTKYPVFFFTYKSSHTLARNDVSNDLDSLSTCPNAIHPDMCDFEIRLDTFLCWEGEARPDELAISGFFYTGVRDAVTCWCCNGGLRFWENEDDPFFEHAKWYPHCEYLLQHEGPEYVREIMSQFQILRRPTTRNLYVKLYGHDDNDAHISTMARFRENII